MEMVMVMANEDWAYCATTDAYIAIFLFFVYESQ